MTQKGDLHTVTIDPVCGMKVNEQQPRGKSEYQGKTFYFCSMSCKEQFDRDPDQYANKSA